MVSNFNMARDFNIDTNENDNTDGARSPIQYYCVEDDDEPLFDSSMILNTATADCDNFHIHNSNSSSSKDCNYLDKHEYSIK